MRSAPATCTPKPSTLVQLAEPRWRNPRTDLSWQHAVLTAATAGPSRALYRRATVQSDCRTELLYGSKRHTPAAGPGPQPRAGSWRGNVREALRPCAAPERTGRDRVPEGLRETVRRDPAPMRGVQYRQKPAG